MDEQRITISALVGGRLPTGLTGVRWPDGSIECRANVSRSDYRSRAWSTDLGAVGIVLTDAAVACDRCVEACG